MATALETAIGLYREQAFEELFDFCNIETQKDVNNIELWKLYGVAAGMTGKPNIAIKCAETVYNTSTVLDPYNLVNLITGYFHNDMAEEAVELINKHHKEVRGDAYEPFLHTINEAFGQYNKEQLLSYLDPSLSKEIREMFDRDGKDH